MAIKNYKSPYNNTAVIDEKILVTDYMVHRNQLITFYPHQSLVDVMEALVKNNIAGACVINEKSQLLGMISEGDCMKKIANSRYYNIPLHDQKVEDYMETVVDTIEPEMNIFDVANLFCTSRRNRFPIVQNGVVVGQISRSNVLKAALEIKPQHW